MSSICTIHLRSNVRKTISDHCWFFFFVFTLEVIIY